MDCWQTWRADIEKHFSDKKRLPTQTDGNVLPPADLVADFWIASEMEPTKLSSICGIGLAGDNPVDRAATVLLLARLITDEPYLRLPEDEAASILDDVRELFAQAVDALPVQKVESPWQCRWELLHACTANRWARVDDLFRRWIALAPDEEAKALTSKCEAYFLSAHPLRGTEWFPDWWMPYEGSDYRQFGEMFATMFARRLDDREKLDSRPWTLPGALPQDTFSRVLEVDSTLQRIDIAAHERADMLRGIAAWTTAVIGVRRGLPSRVAEAAAMFAEIARTETVTTDMMTRPESRRGAAWSSGLLYKQAGKTDQARDAAVLWTSLHPESPEAWKFRAENERLLGHEDYPDSYEGYIKTSTEIDESWEHTDFLQLLLNSKNDKMADRALRELAFSHPERPALEEYLAWEWPTYLNLGEETKRRWWEGLVFICDPRARALFRRHPWQYAAQCFGECVATELKHRVFFGFATKASVDVSRLSEKEQSQLRAIKAATPTLGVLLAVLRTGAEKKDSALGQEIQSYLFRHHRKLRDFMMVPSNRDSLALMKEARDEAVHADIEPEQAKQAYQAARRFLDVLLAE